MQVVSGMAGQISAPNGGIPDISGLTQMVLAVKQYKMQEAQVKRSNAQQKLDIIMKNPAILAVTPPADIDKALKEGYDLKINDEAPINPNGQPPVSAAEGAQPPTAAPAGQPDPRAISAIGNAAQGNKAGAQAGSPPSPGAANKAPGGGVVPSGNPAVEQMAKDAHTMTQQQVGHFAGLYAGAQDQLKIDHMKAQTSMEIETLRQQALDGDARSMGRLQMYAGKQITDSDLRAMVAMGNGDPKDIRAALDVALGNETGADRAKRMDTTLKTLTQSPEIMGKLVNPLDITRVASSIVNSGTLPEGLEMKNISMADLKEEADYEKMLMTEQGVPWDIAHTVARARTLGVPASQAVPPAFQKMLTGPSLASRKVGATEKQASASMVSARADMIKAEAEKVKVEDAHAKIDRMLALDENKELNETVKSMIEADKAKHPFPDMVKQGILDELAGRVGLLPEETNTWWHFITGGVERTYKENPASKLAQEAAGAKPGGKPEAAAGDSKTIAERGGLVGMFKEKVGDVKSEDLDPFNLEHKLLTKGRDQSLSWLHDIVFGKAPDAK